MTEVQTSAPGRVNLIGEHTDYSGGFVLPLPIPQRAQVNLKTRDDDRVRVWSREIGDTQEYQLGDERRTGDWLDYVMGCTHAARTAGHAIGGAALRITSEVPLGAGLGSSAALEVALLRAFREAFELELDDTQLALLGQRAEHEIVGAPVGVMDQLCASLGEPGAALFIDTRSLVARHVSVPRELDLLVIASGIRHDHAHGDYRTRRAECEEAARLLGVSLLRELDVSDLPRIATLPPPLDRRARHVVSENVRVLATVTALERGDLQALGPLFAGSHLSLRDDFEVSIPAIDLLVELASSDPQVIAARLTGGGFGGSIVAFAHAGAGARAAQRITAAYAAQTSNTPLVLIAGTARAFDQDGHG
jgi:galactokinase